MKPVRLGVPSRQASRHSVPSGARANSRCEAIGPALPPAPQVASARDRRRRLLPKRDGKAAGCRRLNRAHSASTPDAAGSTASGLLAAAACRRLTPCRQKAQAPALEVPVAPGPLRVSSGPALPVWARVPRASLRPPALVLRPRVSRRRLLCRCRLARRRLAGCRLLCRGLAGCRLLRRRLARRRLLGAGFPGERFLSRGPYRSCGRPARPCARSCGRYAQPSLQSYVDLSSYWLCASSHSFS